ncbi:MAG: hypothetical protein ACI9QV_001431 [Methylophagaceae bacterium]|jgi:hypothetical protein
MKAIFLTFTTTIAVACFGASLFLNSILGAFGLVSTSIDTFSDLKASHLVMEKMKIRHQIKQQNITKKLAKRSSRRVASASLAAATLGTVAVAVTMTGFELHDYCEGQASLQIDSNILYGTNGNVDFDACIDKSQDDSLRILNDVKQSAYDTVNEAMHSAVDIVANIGSH